MTRINTIAPKDLLDEWLLAEWRELPRIINELEKHPNRLKLKDIPSNYTLNKGHVKFFRNKLLYLAKRHRELKRELKRRGYTIDKRVKVELHYLSDSIKSSCLNDWEPNKEDHKILIDRLAERYSLRKRPYHMEGKIVDGFNGVKYFDHLHKKYLK